MPRESQNGACGDDRRYTERRDPRMELRHRDEDVRIDRLYQDMPSTPDRLRNLRDMSMQGAGDSTP